MIGKLSMHLSGEAPNSPNAHLSKAWSREWEDHHNSAKENDKETPKERFGTLRTRVYKPTTTFGKVIFSPNFESFGGIVVFINFWVMAIETNANASGDEPVLDWVKHINRMLLSWYCFECFSRLYLTRMDYFFSGWNLLDSLIVSTGIFGEIMEAATSGGNGDNLKQIAMLKTLRMLRMIRLVRLLVAFRELYVLLAGIARCMKTLLWASLLIIIVINLWAILSVEYLKNLTEQLGDEGSFGTCSWCPKAFSSIWLANLTWFQVISGDGWSDVGRPLAETYYYPWLFFVSCIFIIVWGLLNLIIAAIVECSIVAREDDLASKAKIEAKARAEAWTSFKKMCEGMDTDGSGTISLLEFQDFTEKNEDLRHLLTTMGINRIDLDNLLKIMDVDGSGTLEHHEFVNQFTQLRTLIEKTAMFYLLKYSEHHSRDIEKVWTSVNSLLMEVRELKLTLTGSTFSSSSPVAARESVMSSSQALPARLQQSTDAQKARLSARILCKESRRGPSVNDSLPQSFPLPTPGCISPALDGHKGVDTSSSCYSCSNSPVGTAPLWEPIPSPKDHPANVRGDRVASEWGMALARAGAFRGDQEQESSQAQQRSGWPAQDANDYGFAVKPKNTPVSAGVGISSACVSKDASGKILAT